MHVFNLLHIPETVSIKPSLPLLEIFSPDWTSFLRNPSVLALDPSFLHSLGINTQRSSMINLYPLILQIRRLALKEQAIMAQFTQLMIDINGCRSLIFCR